MYSLFFRIGEKNYYYLKGLQHFLIEKISDMGFEKVKDLSFSDTHREIYTNTYFPEIKFEIVPVGHNRKPDRIPNLVFFINQKLKEQKMIKEKGSKFITV